MKRAWILLAVIAAAGRTAAAGPAIAGAPMPLAVAASPYYDGGYDARAFIDHAVIHAWSYYDTHYEVAMIASGAARAASPSTAPTPFSSTATWGAVTAGWSGW